MRECNESCTGVTRDRAGNSCSHPRLARRETRGDVTGHPADLPLSLAGIAIDSLARLVLHGYCAMTTVMQRIVPIALLLSGLAGCSSGLADPVDIDPDEAGLGADGKADGVGSWLPDVRCADDPSPGPSGGWRHKLKSSVITRLPSRHRGIDTIASADQASQTVSGEITYGLADKALEDEWVQVYACRAGAWISIDRSGVIR